MTPAGWKKAALLLVVLLGVDGVCAALLVAEAYRAVHRHQVRERADAAVLFFGGEPDPALLASDVDKLDHAHALLDDGTVGNIVCVGGSRSYTERVGARMMREYLLRKGVPGHQLFADSTSFDSRSNWQNAHRIAVENGWRSVLLISAPLHLYRLLDETEGTEAMTVAAAFPDSWNRPGAATAGTLWSDAHVEALAWTAGLLLADDVYRNLLRYLRNRRLL